MGRKPKYAGGAMVRAALRLAAERGPHAVTVAAVARAVGAPTGSLYHRFRSREQLLAELWMDVVEGFQRAFIDALERAEDVEGAVEAARVMTSWTREHAAEARLLLLHHRRDFVAGAWPPALVARAAALEPALGEALRSFAGRVLGRADADAMHRLRYALLDSPLGAVRSFVQSGKPAPPLLDELIGATVRATLQAPRRPRRRRR